MESESARKELTEAEKARIERNRLKAQHLRESKVAISKEDEGSNTIKINGSKYIDTAGGFLLDEREQEEEESERAAKIAKIFEEDATDIPLAYQKCVECDEEFADSYLYKNFGFSCCDKCKNEENSMLITKTTARDEFLLKDCDFDRREPPLKFISRKNPHKSTWAEMKLYLRSQVEARALEVFESLEKIAQEKQIREEKKEMAKAKKFNKKLSELRKTVRSTLYDKTTKKHEHEFGESTYNPETEEYFHECLKCEYSETYEEL
ncbi:CLUMA_CG017908, isoform A [Clunio marinus]|uniref:CLUMA_CG017908, isoform A n=1 Tax=Clunio marinus TaxID=568069 RepID=A0A1J1IXI0_9DIPT|nr:CLUMA_CG017908, isoform A [Clunio marinus]